VSWQFCTRCVAASRVLHPVFTSSCRSYINLRVLLTRALVLQRAQRGPHRNEDPQSRGWFHSNRLSAQRWGWPHRVGGDGEDVLCSHRVTALSWASVGSVGVCSSRASSSLFEGCDMEEGWERVAQCHEMTPATPHSTRTTP
jgi:hypothetical protein